MKQLLPKTRKASAWRVCLPDGLHYITCEYGPRPFVTHRKPFGFEDRETAEAFASQVGGTVEEHKYKWMPGLI